MNDFYSSFMDKEAIKYGINEAIVIDKIRHWIIYARANNKNLREGRYWVYNSIPSWKEIFPWWSEDTIKRTLKSLREQNIVLTGNYNKMDGDKTLWYTLSDDAFYHNKVDNVIASSPDGWVQNAPMGRCKMPRPLPLQSTTNNPTTILEIDKSEVDTGAAIVLDAQLAREIKKAKAARAKQYPAEFVDFYAIWPGSFGKDKVFAAWTAAIQSGAKPLELVSAAKYYAKDKGKYMGSPINWLNDDRWRTVKPSTIDANAPKTSLQQSSSTPVRVTRISSWMLGELNQLGATRQEIEYIDRRWTFFHRYGQNASASTKDILQKARCEMNSVV